MNLTIQFLLNFMLATSVMDLFPEEIEQFSSVEQLVIWAIPEAFQRADQCRQHRSGVYLAQWGRDIIKILDASPMPAFPNDDLTLCKALIRNNPCGTLLRCFPLLEGHMFVSPFRTHFWQLYPASKKVPCSKKEADFINENLGSSYFFWHNPSWDEMNSINIAYLLHKNGKAKIFVERQAFQSTSFWSSIRSRALQIQNFPEVTQEWMTLVLQKQGLHNTGISFIITFLGYFELPSDRIQFRLVLSKHGIPMKEIKKCWNEFFQNGIQLCREQEFAEEVRSLMIRFGRKEEKRADFDSQEVAIRFYNSVPKY